MSTSRFGVVVDALVSVLTAAGLTVVDGQPLRAAEIGRDVVYVGWDGGSSLAGDSRQSWAGIGNHARDEELTVTGYAESTRGSTDTKTARDAALALFAAVETAVRNDPQLAGALTGPSIAQIDTAAFSQLQTADGARCGVQFAVHVFARL